MRTFPDVWYLRNTVEIDCPGQATVFPMSLFSSSSKKHSGDKLSRPGYRFPNEPVFLQF